MKRLFDLCLVLLLIVPALVVSVVAALFVWADGGGAPLFRQTRVGKNRQPFTLLKLRTMTVGTRHAASHEIGDEQITKVGRVLRRTKVDELPQVWNVLVGEMSFVGPRPCLPSQEQLVRERERRGVFSLRPGITGIAQVRGLDMSNPQKLAAVDAEYLTNWQLRRDLACLLATILGKGNGDAAVRGRKR